ncbi:methyltransferase domain-containing protein [Photobacterium sanctipauli]|uniref:Methyltransferase domain-containing protein n=1 Tax=Photobacterium sanctipauli TaxID=1342794 RepID=A0A2T3N978_9GAMM|nr:class I SAM-dependent methyltransferase [Photobacterium sanctipauli]PSW09971.1 methyltransferase domain-containing protein [Photobacterium sanctipauli]
MSQSIQFYNDNAQQMADSYLSLSFEHVHASWKAYWPVATEGEQAQVLDIGAGSGRDAKWFHQQGCEVYAIEPADALRELGKQHLPHATWLEDTLPELKKVVSLGIRFDLILVSAVWMHIPPSERKRAFRKLANLLSPNGKLVISLRHGCFHDKRIAHDVSVEELEQLAKDHALQVCLKTDLDNDEMGRDEVKWQTVVLNLPDDGTGDLTKVRHIIVNDSKSATYKLALLRTLLRVADAHPGAVLDRADGKVALPQGLVALYWVRQFKRLIDIEIDGTFGIQQNSNTSKGLGFVKDDGWRKLVHLSADDLAIGSFFSGDEAKALQKTIKDTLTTIKQGPVTFIYQGNKDNKLFAMYPPTKRRAQCESLFIDSEFLSSFGTFVLDESLWDCLRLYSSWIEPLVVNQWVLEMQRFETNRQRNIGLQTYHDCLIWIDKDHDTREVRKKVEAMRQCGTEIHSVWSGAKLRDQFHVDHCLPFAYWPNNDRWNLLPTTAKENLNKKDRLPKTQRLVDSRDRIIEWWKLAWQSDVEQTRFFDEAVLSLPNLPPQCRNFDDVFEAMGLQVKGVKSRLLVNEW